MKWIFLLSLILASAAVNGQTITPQGSSTTIIVNKGGLQVDSILTIPKRGTGTYYGRTGNIAIDAATNRLKYHNGSQWILVEDNGNGTGNVQAAFIEVNGAGNFYSIQNTPLQNSLSITVNGIECAYSISGLIVTINAPYAIDAGDMVRIHYLFTP